MEHLLALRPERRDPARDPAAPGAARHVEERSELRIVEPVEQPREEEPPLLADVGVLQPRVRVVLLAEIGDTAARVLPHRLPLPVATLIFCDPTHLGPPKVEPRSWIIISGTPASPRGRTGVGDGVVGTDEALIVRLAVAMLQERRQQLEGVHVYPRRTSGGGIDRLHLAPAPPLAGMLLDLPSGEDALDDGG